jgi:hypothetical protein
MMKKCLAIGICLLGLPLLVAQPSAHHAFAAEFDGSKPVNIEGKVVQMEWVSPHAWLTIEVVNKEGKTENWMLEFGPPNILFRSGYRKSSLTPGMVVKVTGSRAKDGRTVASVNTITFPDGKTLSGLSNQEGVTVKQGAPTE